MKQKQYLVIDGDTLSREGLNLIVRQINADSNILSSGSLHQAFKQIISPENIDHVILKTDDLEVDADILLFKLAHKLSNASFILLTANENPAYVKNLFNAGADAVISSRQPQNTIIAEIRKIDQKVQMQRKQSSRHTLNFGKLTDRQKQVMSHIIRGQANKRIAFELGISEGTIKLHVSSILRALKATNRTEAAIKYRQLFEISGEYA